jgi:Flp pilus assembly protein TadD
LRPNDSTAFINLGSILEQKGQMDAAVVVYRKALVQKPDDPEIHARLGGALRQLGILDQAMAHLQLALDMKFEDARTHRELGLALHQKSRINEAMRKPTTISVLRYSRAVRPQRLSGSSGTRWL